MSIFFPLNTSFGRGMLDDPDDTNLVDRALRRLGVMQKPVYGSTNPVRDIHAGLERFQRGNDLAIDGFMRTQGPTAAKLAERLNRSLAEPAPARSDNPWPWGPVAQTTTPIQPSRMAAPPRPRIKPPPPPKVPTPLGPEGSARINRAMDAIAQAREKDPAAPVPGRKPEPPKQPQIQLLPPVDNPVIRSDPAGHGHFGARRDGGKRTHKGIDILAEPGIEVRAPMSGRIRIGRVYRKGHPLHEKFVSIHIESEDGRRFKMFYVAPRSELGSGDRVEAGQPIGRAQNRAENDASGKMRNHLHIELHENGKPIDPSTFISDWFGHEKK